MDLIKYTNYTDNILSLYEFKKNLHVIMKLMKIYLIKYVQNLKMIIKKY